MVVRMIVRACALYLRWERFWEKHTYELVTGETWCDERWYS